MRGPHDGGGVVAERPEHVRVRRDDDEDRRRVGLQHRAGELRLRLGQPQVRTVLGLPAEQVRVVADRQHDDVGVARRVDRARGPGPDRAQREPLGGRRGGARRPRARRRRAAPPPTGRSPVCCNETEPSSCRCARKLSCATHPCTLGASARRIQPAPVQSRPDPAARSVRTPSPQSVTSWWAAGACGGGEDPVRADVDVVTPVGAGPQRDGVGAGRPRPTGSSAVGDRDRVGRRARVPVGEDLVGEGSDDGDAGAGSQGQHAVVLQDDDRTRRRLAGQRAAGGQVEVGRGHRRPRVERRGPARRSPGAARAGAARRGRRPPGRAARAPGRRSGARSCGSGRRRGR